MKKLDLITRYQILLPYILFHLLKFRDTDNTSHGCLNGGIEIYYMKFVLTI